MRKIGVMVLTAAALLAACSKSDDKAATAPATSDSAAPASVPAPAVSAAAPAASLTAAAPAAGQDWTQTVAATPEGGFRMGNPNAAIKLVEYASLTCPHCKAFNEEGEPALKAKYIATGKVSYEYRSFILNGADYAAALLARCNGAATFFQLHDAFYKQQETWVEPFRTMTKADTDALAGLPADQQMAAYAVKGGLDQFVRARGITRARFDQCLADKTQVDKIADMGKVATSKYGLTGTPTFIINEVPQKDVYGWPQLEPKLQAALK